MRTGGAVELAAGRRQVRARARHVSAKATSALGNRQRARASGAAATMQVEGVKVIDTCY